MVWKPNVTVASVLERNGRFLLVEEETEYGVCYNQPAGHLECGESLIDAVIRETLEETAYTLTSAVPDRDLQLPQRGPGCDLPAFRLRWRNQRA
jgi:ADP-ribose pyrophosphatase YjhB (NUDIX family)